MRFYSPLFSLTICWFKDFISLEVKKSTQYVFIWECVGPLLSLGDHDGPSFASCLLNHQLL